MEPRQVPDVQLIALVDVDAMFASCAEIEDPALRGLPLIVAGDPGDRRSVVLTASYPARAHGVRSAMPVRMALRLCPGAVLVAPDHALYRRYSERLFTALQEFTPAVEAVSIDEAYLDMSGCPGLALGALGLGQAIRRRVREATGLQVTVGLAEGRWLAKMAADLAKRRREGALHLTAADLPQRLWPLEIEAFHGVGPKTAQRLRALGIRSIGELAAAAPERISPLGRTGRELRRLALGEEPVHSGRGPARSVSHELTFASDLPGPKALGGALLGLSDQVAYRLHRAGLDAGGLALKVKNRDFRIFSRQGVLPVPSRRTDALHRQALLLLGRMPPSAFPARLAGLTAIRLRPALGDAPELFPDAAESRRDRLAETVSALRERFGAEVLLPAALLQGKDASRKAAAQTPTGRRTPP